MTHNHSNDCHFLLARQYFRCTTPGQADVHLRISRRNKPPYMTILRSTMSSILNGMLTSGDVPNRYTTGRFVSMSICDPHRTRAPIYPIWRPGGSILLAHPFSIKSLLSTWRYSTEASERKSSSFSPIGTPIQSRESGLLEVC